MKLAQNAEPPVHRAARGALAATTFGVAVAACGARPLLPERHRYAYGSNEMNSVVLPPFELRYDGLQRFEYCPPRGDVGQPWIPPIPGVDTRSVAAPAPAAPTPDAEPNPDLPVPTAPVSGELTSFALDPITAAFRHCRPQGMPRGPAPDARVAVVLRVDRTGRVARVETWAACGMTYAALGCLRSEALNLHLPPPAAGSATVVVPAVYFGDLPTGAAVDDSYAAGAAVAIESVQPRLYACMDASRRAGKSVEAQGRFTIDIDRKGKSARVDVDLWRGNGALLLCAGEAVHDAPFPAPPIGWGRVVVTIVFDPGTTLQ